VKSVEGRKGGGGNPIENMRKKAETRGEKGRLSCNQSNQLCVWMDEIEKQGVIVWQWQRVPLDIFGGFIPTKHVLFCGHFDKFQVRHLFWHLSRFSQLNLPSSDSYLVLFQNMCFWVVGCSQLVCLICRQGKKQVVNQ